MKRFGAAWVFVLVIAGVVASSGCNSHVEQVSASDEPDWTMQRDRMVSQQIEARGVKDPLVLESMRTVPRHLFVPKNVQESAYIARLARQCGYAAYDPLAAHHITTPEHVSAVMRSGIDAACLAADLELLRHWEPVRGILLLRPGWQDSAGAVAENAVALERGLTIWKWATIETSPRAWLLGHNTWPEATE